LALRGATPLARQRARVLLAGFAVGQLAPVLGTTLEAVTGMTVPYLNLLWKLNVLFPVAVAYAMVRYDLFDVRAVVRLGTIYGLVTGVVIVAYAGAIALLNVIFTRLGMGASPLATAVVLALAVVLFVNPVYTRAQRVVDRVFFRQRLDVQRSLERLAATPPWEPATCWVHGDLYARHVLLDAPDERIALGRQQRAAHDEQLGEGDEILQIGFRQRGRRGGVRLAPERRRQVLGPRPERAQDACWLDTQGEDAASQQAPPGQPHGAPGPQGTPTSHLNAWVQT